MCDNGWAMVTPEWVCASSKRNNNKYLLSYLTFSHSDVSKSHLNISQTQMSHMFIQMSK